MVKRLTKQAEQQLLNALSDIADLTNEGMSPNEAITKVASDMKIPHGHIPLIVNAYNTGRTTAQRQMSDDVWEKAAEFPIADLSVILEKMYPSKVKSAAEIMNQTVISPEYDLSPSWVTRKQDREKKANCDYDWSNLSKPSTYPTEDHSLENAKKQIRHMDETVKEARYRAAYAFNKAIELKEEIKDYFKSATCRPFQQVKDNSIHLYGKQASNLFDQLGKEEPRLTKQAYDQTKLSSTNHPIYEKVKQCMELTEAYQQLQEDYRTKEQEVKEATDDLMRPFAPGPKLNVLGLPVTVLGKPMVNGFLSKQAEEPKGILSSILGGAAKGVSNFGTGLSKGWSGDATKPQRSVSKIMAGGLSSLTGGPKPPSASALIDPKYYQAQDAAYGSAYKQHIKDMITEDEPEPDYGMEGQMDNLNTESMLSDLMAGDDVISQHDPNEVLQAYSNVRNFIPRSAQHKEVVRSLLREHLQRGHMDPFGLANIAKLENTVGQNEGSLDKGPKPAKKDKEDEDK